MSDTGFALKNQPDKVPIPEPMGNRNRTMPMKNNMGFIDRHRVLVLTSPLWLAVAMVLISFVSGEFRVVTEFMTSSPLR